MFPASWPGGFVDRRLFRHGERQSSIKLADDLEKNFLGCPFGGFGGQLLEGDPERRFQRVVNAKSCAALVRAAGVMSGGNSRMRHKTE